MKVLCPQTTIGWKTRPTDCHRTIRLAVRRLASRRSACGRRDEPARLSQPLELKLRGFHHRIGLDVLLQSGESPRIALGLSFAIRLLIASISSLSFIEVLLLSWSSKQARGHRCAGTHDRAQCCEPPQRNAQAGEHGARPRGVRAEDSSALIRPRSAAAREGSYDPRQARCSAGRHGCERARHHRGPA